MRSTTVEAVLLGVYTALCLVAVLVQVRRRNVKGVVAYGLPMLFGLYITVMAASGVLFVGPGGQGGVGVP